MINFRSHEMSPLPSIETSVYKGSSIAAWAVVGLLVTGPNTGAEPVVVAGDGVVAAAAPQGEALSEDYSLRVNGKNVPVYACRVSAVPFNQVWPGYQRPIEQTELAGFAYWNMSSTVRIVIESRRPVQTVTVRPGNLKIKPTIEGNRIVFYLDSPRQVVVEVNGQHHALHLFGNPPETNVPAKDAPGVRYFGPGVHQSGRITLESEQTVYIAAGAVVYGSIQAAGAKNIRILGRGILDVSPFERGKGGGAVELSDCSDVVIDGIVMRDPDVWCCHVVGCREVLINNVKLIGLWRYNTDGIDIANSQNVRVQDSFVRSFDDSLVVKGIWWFGDRISDQPVRNVRFSRCTLWCDWNVAIKIGTESAAPEITDIVFEDCDIVRSSIAAMGIQPRDRAAIHDIRFENIRVEMDGAHLRPRFQKQRDERYEADSGNYLPGLIQTAIGSRDHAKDMRRSAVSNVLFRNIVVTAPGMPVSSLSGFNTEYGVHGVTIEALSLNGKPVGDAAAANLQIRKFVSNVQVRAAVSVEAEGS